MERLPAELTVEEELVFPGVPPAPANERHFPLRRIVRFGSVVSIILLSVNALVCATWSAFFNMPGWIVWQFVPGALAIAFIPTTILRFRSNHPALRIAYALCGSWLGALDFAFFAALACWIGEIIARLFGWPLPRFQLATVIFGLAAVVTFYGLVNANWLRVTRVTVRLPHLPVAWQGHTVALVTDLHLGPISGAAFLRRVIARLRTLQPEAVFISGDLFDGPTIVLDRLVAPWAEYSLPRRTFFVTGNHDEFSERSLYLEPIKRVGIRVLNNEKTSVEGLQIIGVHDSEAGDPFLLCEILRHARIDPQRPSILLSHRPVNLAVPEAEGVSLQLSGHTHSGQMWPWNLLVSRIYGRAASGLSRWGKMQVYTSNGTGTWGPPLRVGTKSEIILIQLESEIA